MVVGRLQERHAVHDAGIGDEDIDPVPERDHAVDGAGDGERVVGGVDLTRARGGPLLIASLDSLDDLLVVRHTGVERVDARGLEGEPSGEPFDPLNPVSVVASLPTGAPLGDASLADRMLREGAVLAAAQMLGISESTLDLANDYAKGREQFGRPIGDFQLMQGKLADMYTTMNACRAYVYAVASACDRGETTRMDAAGAILYAAEKATWMALEAIQALGGNGYINEFATGRLLRDAKLYEIGAGTSEIRRMLVGRELFNASH